MQTHTLHTHTKTFLKFNAIGFWTPQNIAKPPRTNKAPFDLANIYFIQLLIQTIKATRAEVEAKNQNHHNIKKKFA